MTALRLVPLECGWLATAAASVVANAEGRVELPIPSWLVVHPSGQTLLFDTGLHADVQGGVGARYPGMARQFDARFAAGEEVSGRLEGVDVDPASVDKIVFSHLHFDHCGGTALIPNAQIIVQAAEWKAGHRPKLIEFEVYNPDDFELGHDVLQIDGEHDVFGDGSVVCIPTPGHTAGHQSLRVNLESGPVVLTGDCVYWEDVLDKMLLPPFGFSHDQQLESMRHLRSLRDDHGCRLLYGHDDKQWQSLPHDQPDGMQ
ncbi:MAG: N-acyl homoserine lactonase family protein [Acidimicrobiales bacterium]